jgi:branched-chain amino acid transport system ATP-binding protein
MSLIVRGVTAGYGRSMVLRDVSITVPNGSVVAVIGANGAGKTSLLRVASGLMAPQSGWIRLDGEDLTGRPVPDFAKAGICHVPEGRAVFPGLSVRDNLRVFSQARRERESIERAITLFPRLGERLGQIAGTMSGGEQQMLALARAYLSDCKVILLDELSMGLAPKLVDVIFDSIGRLRREDVGVVVVEQYVDRVLAIADYVYVMSRGRVGFAGDPGEFGDNDLVEQYLGAGA